MILVRPCPGHLQPLQADLPLTPPLSSRDACGFSLCALDAYCRRVIHALNAIAGSAVHDEPFACRHSVQSQPGHGHYKTLVLGSAIRSAYSVSSKPYRRAAHRHEFLLDLVILVRPCYGHSQPSQADLTFTPPPSIRGAVSPRALQAYRKRAVQAQDAVSAVHDERFAYRHSVQSQPSHDAYERLFLGSAIRSAYSVSSKPYCRAAHRQKFLLDLAILVRPCSGHSQPSQADLTFTPPPSSRGAVSPRALQAYRKRAVQAQDAVAGSAVHDKPFAHRHSIELQSAHAYCKRSLVGSAIRSAYSVVSKP